MLIIPIISLDKALSPTNIFISREKFRHVNAMLIKSDIIAGRIKSTNFYRLFPTFISRYRKGLNNAFIIRFTPYHCDFGLANVPKHSIT